MNRVIGAVITGVVVLLLSYLIGALVALDLEWLAMIPGILRFTWIMFTGIAIFGAIAVYASSSEIT